MTQYHYASLRTSTSIRLLSFDLSSPSIGNCLSIQLEEFNLSENDQYQALSYTWGDTNETVPIRIGTRTLRITSNLHNFLRRLQGRLENASGGFNAFRFWADQICINQKDIPERNSQVALMADIYRRSQRTLVWLGEAADGSGHAMDLLLRIDKLHFNRETSLNSILPSAVTIVEEYFASEGGMVSASYISS